MNNFKYYSSIVLNGLKMNCEMCGRETELYETIVEGTKLEVCKDCSSFGNVVAKKEGIEEKVKPWISEKRILPGEKEIVVDDCANIVKSARERKKMTQKDLAMAIAEKESVIHKIESGQIIPWMKTAKKLEQFLRVKLITKYEGNSEGVRIDFKDNTMTIGDILKIKEKKDG